VFSVAVHPDGKGLGNDNDVPLVLLIIFPASISQIASGSVERVSFIPILQRGCVYLL